MKVPRKLRNESLNWLRVQRGEARLTSQLLAIALAFALIITGWPQALGAKQQDQQDQQQGSDATARDARLYTADARATAAARCANCALSGLAGGADSGG